MKTNSTLLSLALVWLTLPSSGWAFYNPESGRWLNRDPIAELGFRLLVSGVQPFLVSEPYEEREQENPRELNVYAFVLNDPLDYVDPDGRSLGHWEPPEPPSLGLPGGRKIKPVFVYWQYRDVGCPSWWACIISPPPDPPDTVIIHPRDQAGFSKCMATARQFWNNAGRQPWSPPNVVLLDRACRYAGKCYQRFW